MKRQKSEGHVVYKVGSKMAKDKSVNEVAVNSSLASGISLVHIGLNPQAVDATAGGAGSVNRPLTVSGLRWNIGVGTPTTTALLRTKWLVWVRRKGQAIPSLSFAAGVADAWPSLDENNIIVWGTGISTQGSQLMFDGATKTQRKMQVGDQLIITFFTQDATAPTTSTASFVYSGIIQTFYKS